MSCCSVTLKGVKSENEYCAVPGVSEHPSVTSPEGIRVSVPASFQYGAISSGTSCFLPQSLQTKDHPSGYSMTPIIAPPCFTLDECAFLLMPTDALVSQRVSFDPRPPPHVFKRLHGSDVKAMINP